MKNLKVILAMVIMVAVLSTVSFALPDDYFAFDATEIEYESGNVVVTYKYIGADDTFNRSGTIQLNYDSANWKVESLESDIADATLTDVSTYVKWTLPASGTFPVKNGDALLKVTFSPVAGGTAIGSTIMSYKAANVRSATGTSMAANRDTSDAKVVIVAPEVSDPEPSVAAGAVVAGATEAEGYTDVPTFTGSVAVENAAYLGSKKVMLTPSVYANGVLHKEYAAVDITGLTIDESGNIAFKLAVIGAPEDVAVTASATAALVD